MMRIAFAGTPEFARAALASILAAGFEVPLVLSQPDRPAGRGHRLQASPVKELALARAIPVHQPERLKDPAAYAPLADAKPDLLVVAAYGLILPPPVLDLPRLGCVNIHASLLPRWRGAAPIQRAIEAGDRETGITLMRMEAGLDTGPMLLQESIAIAPTDNAADVHEKLASLGARLIVDGLRRFDSLLAVPQSADGVTYAAKIDKGEAPLDFRRPAVELARRVLAFDPHPGCTGVVDGLPLKLWQARAEPGEGEPGTVLAANADGIVVACGKGVLRLSALQKAGSRRLNVREFLSGTHIVQGSRFALPS